MKLVYITIFCLLTTSCHDEPLPPPIPKGAWVKLMASDERALVLGFYIKMFATQWTYSVRTKDMKIIDVEQIEIEEIKL